MKKPSSNPGKKLAEHLKALIEQTGFEWTADLENDLPQKWKLFGNLVFLREGSCFTSTKWSDLGMDLVWQSVALALNIDRIAIYRGVKADEFRSPDVKVVWRSLKSIKEDVNNNNNNDECWVTKRENGIIYSFDATKSMFSLGNFSEKARLAELVNREPVISNDGEVAVDMFAGIGYFSLSLLVKCPRNRIKKLHCCEWNPAAVKALRRNLVLNNVSDENRCLIHEGDCRVTAPSGVCQRVFLGLIPSSELAWPAACRAISPQTGGVIHIHTLVDLSQEALSRLGSSTDPNLAEANRCITRIAPLLAGCHPTKKWSVTCSHVSNVKFYGPLLRHVVVDLHCSLV